MSTKWECLNKGAECVNERSNFDDVFNSMFLLFELTTTEGWINVMWKGVDSTEIDMQPRRDYNYYFVSFFIFFTMFASLFILNLFMEVVVNTFSSEKEKLQKNHMLTDTQKEWV